MIDQYIEAERTFCSHTGWFLNLKTIRSVARGYQSSPKKISGGKAGAVAREHLIPDLRPYFAVSVASP